MRSVALTRSEFVGLATTLLDAGHTMRFQVHGGSMYPFIRNGDIAEVRPVDVSGVQLGDIILCRPGGVRLVVHRVIGIGCEDGHTTIVTKGDALSQPDARVTEADVLGRVVAVQRGEREIRLDRCIYRFLGLVWLCLTSALSWCKLWLEVG